ncbi:hypothetical protein AA106555_1861 [Neokomagataea thailandica NBRC 106555]|uniref:Uncharacterized protein n=2 Tax=Neokomagataea TaxID=1223423 RepID=A0A4Y6V7F4_9PROT|nr:MULTISPECIES: hypothetical protein [Neokomagataea]QDH24610.1 hypothetical protein D5366_04425 [Neokomagataea tanensis]GBR54922.1 hypothetical protein AA106555_1861 [Neokomagataea thailandica NBRC 106555]
MAPFIRVISFISEGQNYDTGYDLTTSARILQEQARNVGADFKIYSPSVLRGLGVSELIREYPDALSLPNNPFLHKVGFAAWKPFIILHELASMKEGDILIYVDGNVHKYHGLVNYVRDYKNLVDVCLNDRDFYIGREQPGHNLRSRDYTKANQIHDIALDAKLADVYPLLIVNNIMARVTKTTQQFFLNWLALCMQERYILPPRDDEFHHSYRWFCPEQSNLNMLVIRYILERRLAPQFPGISCERDGIPRIADNGYVHDAGELIQPDLPFEQQFASEIEEAQNLLQRVTSRAPLAEDWSILPCTFDDWTSHEDDASTSREQNGDLVFCDGTDHRYHLMRYRHHSLDHAVVMLEMDVRFLKDETRFLVNQWGGHDICAVSANMDIVKSINCIDVRVGPRDENGFHHIKVIFLNYHESVSIGSIKTYGIEPGEGTPSLVFRNMRLGYRRFSKL